MIQNCRETLRNAEAALVGQGLARMQRNPSGDSVLKILDQSSKSFRNRLLELS